MRETAIFILQLVAVTSEAEFQVIVDYEIEFSIG